MKMVHTLEMIQPDEVETHGGKAVNLGKLAQSGFLIPRGFSISTDAFTQMVESSHDLINFLKKVDDSEDFEEILEISENLQRLIEEYQVPKRLESEISLGIQNLKELSVSSELGFAIRSSATIEDHSDVSFAGQAESYLCVKKHSEIIEFVKKVWQSAFSERAIVYLKAKAIPIRQLKVAVVVQEMIPAEISGVMFTANVVNNNADELLINATWGLGDCLVSGKIVPDTYVLTKSPFSVIQRTVGEKELTSKLEMNQLVLIETPKDRQSKYTLDDETLFDIAEIGLKIENVMECPQDIEWCIKPDGVLVILQSRPITTLSVPSSHKE
nr:MAG: hypothetical protein AM325_07120 [Candidatus Thorarchaeota archaeon SMTZ1-45]